VAERLADGDVHLLPLVVKPEPSRRRRRASGIQPQLTLIPARKQALHAGCILALRRGGDPERCARSIPTGACVEIRDNGGGVIQPEALLLPSSRKLALQARASTCRAPSRALLASVCAAQVKH